MRAPACRRSFVGCTQQHLLRSPKHREGRLKRARRRTANRSTPYAASSRAVTEGLLPLFRRRGRLLRLGVSGRFLLVLVLRVLLLGLVFRLRRLVAHGTPPVVVDGRRSTAPEG